MSSSQSSSEEAILIQAIRDSNSPKLVYEDLKLFQQFLEDVFPEAAVAVEESPPLEVNLMSKNYLNHCEFWFL